MAEDTQKIDVGGHALRVRALGEGPTTFVLVHGFADGLEAWAGVAERLARRARVILVEQRGHGYSGGPAGPYDWEGLGRDLIGVLDGLGIERAVLVGHALGGLACLFAALQAPERVERLVLLGTATEADAGQQNWCHEVVKAGRMNALQGIAHAIFGPMSRKQVEGSAGPLIELARLMETLRDSPVTDRAAHVRSPTLVLRGEKDPAHAQALADAIPGASYRVLSGLGPFAHKKDPAAVAAEIEAFVAA